jgi:hypothetical protein
MIKTSLSALALAAAFATSGSAATVTFTAVGSTGVPAGYGADIGDASWIDAPATVDGSLSGQYASPYGEGVDGETDYFTVGTPSLPESGSPAVMLLASAKTTFSMLWGTVDIYNAVTFCGSDDLCATVSGSQVKAALNASEGTKNAIVNFTSDFAFTTVSFFSNFNRTNDQAAFEFAVAPVPVPLPAGGLLLLGALGGIAALRRRKAAV